MKIFGIIPARMASTRFPNKPMAKILGIPMIGHVYYRCKMCTKLSEVWVATCDQEIYDYIRAIGGRVVMTASTHERASDRTAEAMLKIEEETGQNIDAAVMVQGDEPMLVPEMIDELTMPLNADPQPAVVNLIERIESNEEFNSPNIVKVVIDKNDNILYYSREPIPSTKKFKGEVPMWKQLGIILFKRQALLDYSKTTPTPLEIIESVDMNRFIECGVKIKSVATNCKTFGVDTERDLLHVEALMNRDELVCKYIETYRDGDVC